MKIDMKKTKRLVVKTVKGAIYIYNDAKRGRVTVTFDGRFFDWSSAPLVEEAALRDDTPDGN